MDLPHNPSSPDKLYEAVSSEVSHLWHYIQNQDIPSMKVEIKWKKQCYGAWCTVRWFPRLYCHCNEEQCSDGKFVIKETKIIVKNDFGLELFRRFITSEKSWIDNFCRE